MYFTEDEISLVEENQSHVSDATVITYNGIDYYFQESIMTVVYNNMLIDKLVQRFQINITIIN